MNEDCLSSDGKVMREKRIEDMVTSYIAVHCGLRGLDPKTLEVTYLPGIAAIFDKRRAECSQLFRKVTHSKEVKLVLKGFQRRYEECNPRANKIVLPYGYDLAILSRTVPENLQLFKGKDAEVLMQRAFVCQVMGITFLLRKSEHIIKKSKHEDRKTPLHRNQIVFFTRGQIPIAYKDIGNIEAHAVVLNVKFAKADQSGYGRRNKHIRQPSTPDTCTVSILEKYIKTTRDQYKCTETDGVYYLPKHGDLSLSILHKIMQNTVASCGVKDFGKKVTSHSLRYGGATMLAAAGLPHYIIAIYGGWSPDSKSLRIYTKPSDMMANKVSRHMAKMAKEESSIYFINDAYVISKGRNTEGKQIAKW